MEKMKIQTVGNINFLGNYKFWYEGFGVWAACLISGEGEMIYAEEKSEIISAIA